MPSSVIANQVDLSRRINFRKFHNLMHGFNPVAGHIYHAASDRCFLAYTRGPCAPNQYLILPLDSKSATCVPNVCRNDNVVSFRGACYRLHTAGPCPIPEINNVISVNPFTLELECSKSNLLSSTDDNQETNFCRRGGLLWFNGKCGNNENVSVSIDDLISAC